MKFVFLTLAIAVLFICAQSYSIGSARRAMGVARSPLALRMSEAPETAAADSTVKVDTTEITEIETEAETAKAVVNGIEDIPTYLPSEVGVDYVPLATMLATGDFLGADQFTRDNLIKIAGEGAQKREYVYWTEVLPLPKTDLCTMERLWLQFSDGDFGYSVQKRVWDVENQDFDRFIRRIGWTIKEKDKSERKLKWFGKSEFIYELGKAPKGHLPLTSALRGTQLIKKLLDHPVWSEYDWKNYKTLEWKE